MNDLLTRQLVNDRYSELHAEAEQHRLARLRPARGPLVCLRLTIEFQLGGRDHVHAGGEPSAAT